MSTLSRTHTRVNPGHLALNWKILLSGLTPDYVYEQGKLDTSLPFEELKKRSRINDAAKAADALKDNALDKAVAQQEKALAKLQDAADQPPPAQAKAAPPSQPMAKSAEAKAGQPQANEAKTGEPKTNPAQAKANDTKPGQTKAGEPMIQEAKTGESKPGETKPGDNKATVKSGPNNPVGVVWINLSLEHYGLHGTPEPANIGKTESHGCVRLTNWDAVRVASLVKRGTPVVFQ